MQKLLILLAIIGLKILSASAQTCQTCQTDNDAYCVNQTHYYNCMRDGIIGTIQMCKAGTLCTNNELICVEPSIVDTGKAKDVCGGSGAYGAECKICTGTNKYTCVSSTQYSRCVDTTLSTNSFACDSDEVCVLSALKDHGTICVPKCTLSFLELEPSCSNTVEITTTTPAPTTAADYKNVCKKSAESSSNSLFFYTINTEDSTCQSYIYCDRPSATAAFTLALYIKCATANPYYNSTTKKCVSTKPTNC